MNTNFLIQNKNKVNLTISADSNVKRDLEEEAARLKFNKSKFANSILDILNKKLRDCKDIDEVGDLITRIEEV